MWGVALARRQESAAGEASELESRVQDRLKDEEEKVGQAGEGPGAPPLLHHCCPEPGGDWKRTSRGCFYTARGRLRIGNHLRPTGWISGYLVVTRQASPSSI